MTTESVPSGERVKLAGQVDAGQLWTVEVENAPIRVSTRRNRADDGSIIRNGDLFFVGVPDGSELWAYGDGGSAADVTLDAVSGDFPERSGTLYLEPLIRSQITGSVDANIINPVTDEFGDDAVRVVEEAGMFNLDKVPISGDWPGRVGMAVNVDEASDNRYMPLQSSVLNNQSDSALAFYPGVLTYLARALVSVDVDDSLGVADRTLSGLTTGQATVATSGTAVQFNGGTSVSVPAGSAVKVSSPSSNAGDVYLGDDSVDASTGFVLSPGDPPAEFPVDDVATLYADAANDGDAVSWAVVGA